MDDDSISRDVHEGDGPGGIDVRRYTYGEDSLPSVTSVLKTRDEDMSALTDWQDRNDGEDGAADYEHLFWYSRQVGTLSHWNALRLLEPDLTWTADEAESRWALGNVSQLTTDEQVEATDPMRGHEMVVRASNHEEVHDSSAREVLYSALRGDKNKAGGRVSSWGEFYEAYEPYRPQSYYERGLLQTADGDISFFTDAQQTLWDQVGIADVLSVERFLFNKDDGYAGQVDLVYEDEEGNVVVADLKSSSGCYDKHQLQGAAYARAVERADGLPDSVDRIEVHRAHPRSGEMAVHTHKDAPGQRPVHTTKWWSDNIETLYDEFSSLLTNF